MPKISFSVCIVLCIIFLAFGNDELPMHTSYESKGSETQTRNTIADSEIQRRREIAKNYLDTLARAKGTWVDPYDMIAYPVDERQTLPPLEQDASTSSLFNEPNVDSDYRPLFSDIRGEVIGSNSLTRDESDDDRETGKLFSNGRHQICVLDSIYISRWLKKLILKIETDSELEPNALIIPLDSESLVNLKALSTAKTMEITDLDELVCSLISKVTILRKETYDWTILTSYVSNLGWGFCVLVASCIFFYIFYHSIVNKPVFTLIASVIVVSIISNWMQLYQKQVARKHAQLSSMQMPAECRKHDFDLLEHIHSFVKSFFTSSTDDCGKYYEALMVDPFWEVSLTVAISDAVASTIFQPLYSGSKAVNAAIKLLFEDLPIFSMSVLIALLFVVFIMLCNYKLRLPFFMGSLEPSNSRHRYVEDIPQMSYNMLNDDSFRGAQNFQGTCSNRSLTRRKNVPTTGLFGNENIPKIGCCVSKHVCSNAGQVVDSKLLKDVPMHFSKPTFATCLNYVKSDESVDASHIKESKADGDEYCSYNQEDFESIGGVKADLKNCENGHNLMKLAKHSVSNIEQISGDGDSSIENICAACESDSNKTSINASD